MITVNGAFATRLDDIQSQVGTSVTVRPAGSFGGGFFERGGENNGGGANGRRTKRGENDRGENTRTSTHPRPARPPPALKGPGRQQGATNSPLASRLHPK